MFELPGFYCFSVFFLALSMRSNLNENGFLQGVFIVIIFKLTLMKRMLFLLMTILLGMNVSFASDKESKKDAENMALYEEAVKAVKEKKFVVKYHTTDVKEYRYEPAVRKRLNSLTNF